MDIYKILSADFSASTTPDQVGGCESVFVVDTLTYYEYCHDSENNGTGKGWYNISTGVKLT